MNLDVGCGYPDEAGVYRKRAEVGIDLRRGYADVVADAHHLPFRPEAFSSAILHSCLDHFNDPYLVLREVNRVVRNTILVMVANPRFWQYNFADDPADHLYQWSPRVLGNLLVRAGFKVRSVRWNQLDRRRVRLRAHLFEAVQRLLWPRRDTDAWRYDSFIIEAEK